MIERVALVCDALGAVLVESLRGDEGMHRLPRWQVTVVSDAPDIAITSVVGQPAKLALGDDQGGYRECVLMVVDAAYVGRGPRGSRYRLTLSTALWGLTQRRGYATFRNLTTADIVAEVLRVAGQSEALSLRLSERYSERGYCAQYDENEWSFLSRLLAEDAIACFVDDDGEHAQLVLTDYGGGHGPIAGGSVRFNDSHGMNASADCFFWLEQRESLQIEGACVRDYDVLQPDVAIEAAAGDGYFSADEYPARVANQDAATARAAARLQQHQRDAVVLHGKTHCVRMVPGQRVTIEGASDDFLNGDKLIVDVTHQLQQASPDRASGTPYLATVRMVPFNSESSYPPPPPAARDTPRVGGVQSAQVTGPDGEEIHVDSLGRIKVRLPYDRSERHDDESSDWVRCMQWNMGGSMMLPRVGWEVPLVYEEGHPDAPIALGRLYHGASPLPYQLPSNKACGTLQSATSPADGSSNEFRMTDDAGKQEMMLHASRDHTVAVGGDATIEISANQTLDAASARKLSVKGSQSASIGANQTVTVAAAMGTKVSGARSVTVAANETIGADLSRIEAVSGSYTEMIAGLASTRCNTAITSVKGALSHNVGAACVVAAGCGTNELVGGARLEAVAGARSVKAGKADEDTIGLHHTSAGVASLKAGGALVVKAKAAAKISASITKLNAGGTLMIEAPTISITAASASLGKRATLKLSGGHKAAGGKVSVKAPAVTHAGGTKAKS